MIFKQNLIAPITSIAFKSNKIVQADIEGQLIIWDLKEQISRVVSTNRTVISKIRFSPDKGFLRLLILFVDGGVDMYDLKQVLISKLRITAPVGLFFLLSIENLGI